MKNNMGRLAAYVYALCLLAGCANGTSQIEGKAPLLSPEQVADRCLAAVTPKDAPPPERDNFNGLQWARYVYCAIGSNLWVNRDLVRENPEATVEIQIADDGSVRSIKRLHTSGNAAWDRAVDRSIGVMPALPPAPAVRRSTSMDLHFEPFRQGLGMSAGAALTGQSHWSVHRCTQVGGVSACD
jgi:TonB family protein